MIQHLSKIKRSLSAPKSINRSSLDCLPDIIGNNTSQLSKELCQALKPLKMVYKSPYRTLDIPETNTLSYLFPQGSQPSEKSIWIDAKDPSNSLSPRQALVWIKRIGALLEMLQIAKGEAVMIFTPNHIFVPIAYLGIVGAERVFSGANPIYTVAEVEHQIRNTATRLILTHPTLVETAVEAGRRAGLAKDRILQFSDRPCPPRDGIKDWREVVVSAENYSWDHLGPKSKTTLATINYSSGTTGLPKGVCVSRNPRK